MDNKQSKLALFAISVVAGVLLTTYLIGPQTNIIAENDGAATTAAPQTKQTKDASSEGVVASAQTTQNADGSLDTSIAVKLPARKNTPAQTQPDPVTLPPLAVPIAPVTPQNPTPITITVNLRTPLTYTLKPGQRTPILQHEMIDDVQYEWYPGQATTWQNEPVNPGNLPVWSVIALDKPAAPYVSDVIPFYIEAAKNAPPGKYKVKIIVQLHSNVRLGIPVLVTVPEQ